MKSHSGSRWLGCTLALAFTAAACSTAAARPTLTSETIPGGTTPAAPAVSSTIEVVGSPTVPLTGEIQYELVASYPHDTDAFTQGLEFVGADLYESTGQRGESDLRITDPVTGEVRQEAPLNPTFFGEGMTVRDGLVYQLTYTSGLLLIADASDLEPAQTPIAYEGEGWGLCTTTLESDRPFVMSNGSSELTIRDPETFAVRRTVPVTGEDGSPILQINELECVGTQVLANIWKADEIVAIDLITGQVAGRLNLADLVPEGVEPGRAFLNGIAYQKMTGTYFVTGKLWPVMYELRLTSG